ncbi:MAG TPA: 2'-5' RNA ligase family protein [Polyangiaceae bacterium]|jgi:2'-5' RNA ligase
MPRPNWFFGFPVDGAFLLTLPDLPPSIRRFHPEDAHMTLAFLGGCGEEAALRALGALDVRLQSEPLAPLRVSLAEVVPMGSSRRHYTALSALLGGGREQASELIAAYRDTLTEAATGRREKRPPKPHVTLARPRGRATDANRAAGLSWAAALDLSHVHAVLDRVALYTWPEDRRERMFKIVAERRLSPENHSGSP